LGNSYKIVLFDQNNDFVGNYYFGEGLSNEELKKKAIELSEGFLRQFEEIQEIRWEIVRPIEEGSVSR
jgi:hypothetical protein